MGLFLSSHRFDCSLSEIVELSFINCIDNVGKFIKVRWPDLYTPPILMQGSLLLVWSVKDA